MRLGRNIRLAVMAAVLLVLGGGWQSLHAQVLEESTAKFKQLLG